MPDPVLLQERLISGKGILRLPATARKVRYFILYLDVIRRPRNEYLSFEWNPTQSLYARFSYLRNNYVVANDYMRYQRELRTQITDISGQNLRAVKCAYRGTLQSFANLATGLGLVVTEVTDKIQDFESLFLNWDELRFVCYADTAIQARLFGLNYDNCDPDLDDTQDPPPPPPPREPVPPGTPIPEIDDAFDGDNDDGNTVPFPGDSEPPDLPFGDDCVLYRVTIAWVNLDGRTGEGTFTLFGPIDEPGVSSDQRALFILARGGPDSIDPPAGLGCVPVVTQCFVVGSTDPDFLSVQLINIVPA